MLILPRCCPCVSHMQLDVLKLFYAKSESEVLEVQELPDPLALHCNRLTGPYYANRYAKVGQISAVDGDKAAAQWSSVIAAAKKNSPEIFHQFF